MAKTSSKKPRKVTKSKKLVKKAVVPETLQPVVPAEPVATPEETSVPEVVAEPASVVQAPAPQVPAAVVPVSSAVPVATASKKPSALTMVAIGCGVLLAFLIIAGVVGGIIYWVVTRNSSGDIGDFGQFDLTTGNVNEEASATIGNTGGVVEVEDRGSPLYGASVELGEGFVTEEEEFSIGYKAVDNAKLPDKVGLISDVIVLSRENEGALFAHPVAVTVPYDEDKVQYGELISVYELVDTDGNIAETTLLERDDEAHTITFLTSHFSDYIVAEYLATFEEMLAQSLDTGFVPENDGWFIRNWGSYVTDGGNCMGMSMFAKYYYKYQKNNDGNYIDRFIEGNASNEQDDKVAQELAARAQMAMGNRWNTLSQDLTRFSDPSRSAGSMLDIHGQAVIMDLMVTGEPQLVDLRTWLTVTKADGTREYQEQAGGHMVLIYKYDGEQFFIYDPNDPYRSDSASTSLKQVGYKIGEGFEVYDSAQNAGAGDRKYNVIRHVGTSLMTETQLMDGLYAKAEAGFPDDEFPDITYSTPEAGAAILLTSVTVTGYVEGGDYEDEAGQKYMHWYYPNGKGGLDYLRSEIDEDGYFEQVIPLSKPGETVINTLAAGESPTAEWAGWNSLTVDAQIQPADMLVTLSWATDQTDIDLHVIDPNGEAVDYTHKLATTGAELDVDDTNGFGPEHYTISSAEGDQMPFGDYSIFLIYYADHDGNSDSDQVTPWTVNVKWVSMVLPDGEEVWEEHTFNGTLTYDGGSSGERNDVYTVNFSQPQIDDFEVEQWSNIV